MDPAAWAAYNPHYSRLSGGVNAQAAHAQLNDLTLAGSLTRQDALGGYGASGPPPPHSHPHAPHSALLLSHHNLNISQTGHHADPSTFVNSPNLLATGYDQMLSASQFQSKGHLGHLNVAHPPASLYKGVGKEPELTELRGGFTRRGQIPAATATSQASNSPVAHRGSPTDNPMAHPSAGLFNHQSPHSGPPPSPTHHTWRHAGMVPGSTGPFGILPHEAFPHATVAEVPEKHHNTPPYKNRSASESQSGRYTDPNVGSHLSSLPAPPSPVPSGGRGPSLMIQQGEPDASGLVLKSGDYPIYSSNMNVSRGIIAGNYVPQGHFSPQGLRGESGEVYSNLGYCGGGPPQKMVSAMYSNVPVSTMVNPTTYIQSPASSRSAQAPPPPARSRTVLAPPQSPSNKPAYTPPGPYPPQGYHMPGPHLQEPMAASPSHENYPSASASPAANMHPQTTLHSSGPGYSMPSPTNTMAPSNDPNNQAVAYSSVITRVNTAGGPLMNEIVKAIPGGPVPQDNIGTFKDADMKQHQARGGNFPIGQKQDATCMSNVARSIAATAEQPMKQPFKQDLMSPNITSGQQMQKMAATPDRNTPNTCVQQQQHHQQQLTSPKEMGVESIFDDPNMTLQDLAEMAPNSDLSGVAMAGMNMGIMGDDVEVGSDHRRHHHQLQHHQHGTMMEALCGDDEIPLPEQQEQMGHGQEMYRQELYNHEQHVHAAPPQMQQQQQQQQQQEHIYMPKETVEPVKKKRGRPKGKKNKKTEALEAAAANHRLEHEPPDLRLTPTTKSGKSKLPPKLCHLPPPPPMVKDGSMSGLNPMVTVGKSTKVQHAMPTPTPTSLMEDYSEMPPVDHHHHHHHHHQQHHHHHHHDHHLEQRHQHLQQISTGTPMPESVPIDNVSTEILAAIPENEDVPNTKDLQAVSSTDLVPEASTNHVAKPENVENGGFTEDDLPSSLSPAVEVAPPKPVVPSIEDELGFLAQLPLDGSSATGSRVRCSARTREKTAAVSDFLGSYLKFLQGEKPTTVSAEVAPSDPPVQLPPEPVTEIATLTVATPKNRKRSLKVASLVGSIPEVPEESLAMQKETNGVKKEKRISSDRTKESTNALAFTDDDESNHVLTDSLQLALKSLSDIEDDGTGVAAKEKLKPRQDPQPVIPKEEKDKEKDMAALKGRKRHVKTETKATLKVTPPKGEAEDADADSFPHRKMSMRTCKQKTMQKHQEAMSKRRSKGVSHDSEGEMSSNSEGVKGEVHYDSDVDPVWTPQVDKVLNPVASPSAIKKVTVATPVPVVVPKLEEEDPKRYAKEVPVQKKSRPRKSKNRKKGRVKGAEDQSGDDSDNEPLLKKARPSMVERKAKGSSSALDDVNEAVRSGMSKIGDFVICRPDKGKEKFPIWKIDEKNLLQKYEQFEENGKFLYKAISVYSGWNPAHRPNYESISVRLVRVERGNMIVEYVKDQKTLSGDDGATVSEEPVVIAKENFEVYIQTLISQALDSNFISEIIKENDEYFLTHVYEIDAVVYKKKHEMNRHLNWDPKLRECIEDFPVLTVSKRPHSHEKRPCEVCRRESNLRIVDFDGELYDHTTLKKRRCEQKLRLHERKSFVLCSKCCHAADAYSKVHHQKYNFYLKCVTKVDDLSSTCESKESHIILEQCLQDLDWMNKLFLEMQTVWTKCCRVR